jgi:hypothetical protein
MISWSSGEEVDASDVVVIPTTVSRAGGFAVDTSIIQVAA